MYDTSSPKKGLIVCLLLLFSFVFGVTQNDRAYKHEQQVHQELDNMRIFNFFSRKRALPRQRAIAAATHPADDAFFGVDISFIKGLEGKKRDGYVPVRNGVPLGRSGVTVASGFDIGQHNEKDLDRLNLPESLKAKLRPYLGLRKWQAVNALRANPLKLTAEEVELLNERVFHKKVRGIIDIVGEDTWAKLDRGVRTVLASVGFQYGDLRRATPNFFNVVKTLDVGAMIRHLENFGDAYPTRRRKEANYLRKFSLLEGRKDTENV